MSKFNETKVPKSVVNERGEKAYEMGDKENLVSSVLTTFVTKSYYESENQVQDKILEAASKCDPLFVAKTAIYARTKANMRSSSHLLAGSLASRVSGKEWAKNFYERIVVRPDDISEILAYYYHDSDKLPNSMRKGFKKAFEKFDAYQLDKYKMSSKAFSLIDLVNLLHPKPSAKMKEAYEDLMTNEGKNLHTMYESKILEKEMSAAGKKSLDVVKNKQEAITTVLSNVKGMPIFNLLRNLRQILHYAPDQVDEACRQLTNPNVIHKSKLLPFRFASAYEALENAVQKHHDDPDDVKFESEKTPEIDWETFEKKRQQLLDAVERALEISCDNIDCFEGNVAILIDHSGSVRGDSGGHSRVSAFSKTTNAMIGTLFGMMIAYKQKDTYVGLFGDELVSCGYDRKEKLLDNVSSAYHRGASCGPATENGLYTFLEKIVADKKHIDNLVIISDMVIGKDGTGGWDHTSSVPSGTFQKLFKEFREINPNCHTVTLNIRSTSGKSVFNPSMNITEISGWSDKIFDIIGNTKNGFKGLIEEIEAIQL